MLWSGCFVHPQCCDSEGHMDISSPWRWGAWLWTKRRELHCVSVGTQKHTVGASLRNGRQGG